MVKLKRIVKDYQTSGSVNSLVNLFGFIDEQVFLTKSGDVGVVLRIQGRDYECLDAADLNATEARLNGSALKLGSHDQLPPIEGAVAPAGINTFEPATITFLAIPTAGNSACR